MRREEKIHLVSDEIAGKEWLGVVVDNDDPLREYRCRVMVYNLFDTLEIDHIPWALPRVPMSFAGPNLEGDPTDKDGHPVIQPGAGFGTGSVPKIGTKVKVIFDNGNIYTPIYFGIQQINEALRQEDYMQDDEDYFGSHTMLYDEDERLKIYYTKRESNTAGDPDVETGTPETGGLHIVLKETHIQIDNENNVYIENVNADDPKTLCRVVMNNTGMITIKNTSDAFSKKFCHVIMNPDGTMSFQTSDDISVETKGDLKVDVLGGNNSKKGKVDLYVKDDTTINIDGNTTINTKKDTKINTEGNTTIDTKKNTTINSGSNTTIETKNNTNIKTSMNCTVECKGAMTVKGASVDIKGAVTHNGRAAPTGSGCFCAIPICPFTGAPHVGNLTAGG